ncbi:hypothetical protein FS847_35400 [Streptomyces sp. ISID311]|nr:hypothetical protein FS847_35400 [Streptomyces sp. ISID311]
MWELPTGAVCRPLNFVCGLSLLVETSVLPGLLLMSQERLLVEIIQQPYLPLIFIYTVFILE